MRLKLIISFIFIILVYMVTAQDHVYFNDLERKQTKGNWLGLSTIDSASAHSGFYYSKTDLHRPYGLGIEQAFPADLIRKNTMVLISGFVKSNTKNNNAMFVVTLINHGETLMWKGIPLSHNFIEENIWYYFSDSVLIPASFTVESKIKAYLWNQNKAAITGVDDLRFEFKTALNPTFIPNIIEVINQNKPIKPEEVLFANNYYSIKYVPPKNAIKIVSKTGEVLINNITYFNERNLGNDKAIFHQKLKFIRLKNIQDGNELNFSISNHIFSMKISLICKYNSDKIIFEIKEKYKKSQTVNRESLVFEYTQPLTEVYRYNRKLDVDYFQDEYWLDHQGAKIGEGDNSLIIYHEPKISSIQLDTKNNHLFVNLDFAKDHPFFRFPLNADSTNWKKEESTSKYKKGDKREFSFSLIVGNLAQTLPRFMKNPSGFEATYIWTEHADFTNIKTNRATYYGSEKITNPDSAIGGFIKFNIPVTKSVFYDNPSITNYDTSSADYEGLHSTILTDKQFSEFLKQIHEKGNDICLHTPEQFTSTPTRLEQALSYMQSAYGSPSWIDHGNNNAPTSNREDLICDGTLKDSPLYAIDLWNKYGVSYLHNTYYEEMCTFKGWQFENSLEKPFSGYGDLFPVPDYFQHPTRSSNIIHWTTTSALFIKEQYLWDYLFNMKKLQRLVDNRAVEINHSYPAWANPKKGMWTYDADSIIIAQPGLNMALANMSQLRDEGKLNVSTIADFLNYRTSIDKIDYVFIHDGLIRLTNNGDNDIVGLAMVAKASAVSVNGIIPNQKKVRNEIIFWFDIKAGESKVIRVIE